jgi:membrane fusion protein (multidrug efflux system)
MHRTIKYIWISIIAGACGSAEVPPEDEVETKKPATQESVTTVVTSIAENKNFQYVINTNGKIKSLQEQLISSENGGRLVVCKARTGAAFSQGSMIARFETTSIEYKLEKARLARFNGQKEYESQLLGYENLLKDKSKEQAEEIKQKLRISTGLAGAEQDIKEANYELTKTVIKAPFTGVLADVKVQQGERVKPNQELFRIYDPANLFLEVKILETDVQLLKKGMPAQVAPVSTSQPGYNATVYEINPYVDESGMVLVKLKISGQAGSRHLLFPGMNCTATIKIPSEKSIVVPKEAVVMRSGKTVVFTLEDNKAKWNYVTVGRDNGQELEIKEGLDAGSKVIITNNLQLANDAPVKEDSAAGPKDKD